MSIGWMVCMSLWLVFMGIWVYLGPIKREWSKSLPFPFIAAISAIIGIFFALIN